MKNAHRLTPAKPAEHHPDTIVLDLSDALTEYKREVQKVEDTFNTNPDSMLSWLTCYIDSRRDAFHQIGTAVADIDSNEPTVPDDIRCKFTHAAENLGHSLVDRMYEHGLFSRDGEFGYQYMGLHVGKCAIFKRI